MTVFRELVGMYARHASPLRNNDFCICDPIFLIRFLFARLNPKLTYVSTIAELLE